jgi:hypothetical protein
MMRDIAKEVSEMEMRISELEDRVDQYIMDSAGEDW